MRKQGKALIEEAQDTKQKGENNVSEGEKLIEQGKRMMADSERQYRLQFPGAELK